MLRVKFSNKTKLVETSKLMDIPYTNALYASFKQQHLTQTPYASQTPYSSQIFQANQQSLDMSNMTDEAFEYLHTLWNICEYPNKFPHRSQSRKTIHVDEFVKNLIKNEYTKNANQTFYNIVHGLHTFEMTHTMQIFRNNFQEYIKLQST